MAGGLRRNGGEAAGVGIEDGVSATFKAAQVVRCPLCYDWRPPAHVGHSCFVCEGCGNTFRVVSAQPGKTGAHLSARIKDAVRWR
jgi:hypothetical protein